MWLKLRLYMTTLQEKYTPNIEPALHFAQLTKPHRHHNNTKVIAKPHTLQTKECLSKSLTQKE